MVQLAEGAKTVSVFKGKLTGGLRQKPKTDHPGGGVMGRNLISQVTFKVVIKKLAVCPKQKPG